MAKKRMFNADITESAKFLKMPVSTQSLYFHLGVNADDDGIVEAYNVLRACGCSEDDLRILVTKEYVTVLNQDLVTYINDWLVHNAIRPDRKIDSIYKDLLVKVFPDAKIVSRKTGKDDEKSSENVPRLLNKYQPDDGHLTANRGQVPANRRIGEREERIEEIRLDSEREEEISLTEKIELFRGLFKNKSTKLSVTQERKLQTLNIRQLCDRIRQSEFLSVSNNLGLGWCIDHSDEIFMDTYKNFQKQTDLQKNSWNADQIISGNEDYSKVFIKLSGNENNF